ncbi:MAG: efflux RND transporter permease subunit [Desulfobacteraceae bacterium]|jgi:multidrug efflux pump subunit AcrB/outer membrane protein TolC
MKQSIFEKILAQRRLILTLTAIICLTGAMMWLTMIRQEDPRLPDFWGQIVAAYPGADAETVERLVLEPIEDALTQVDQIKSIESTAFSEMAVLVVELHGHTENIDNAWDDVREALQTAQHDFPQGVALPVLNEDQTEQDAVVLAITGSGDPLVLMDTARKIKKELLRFDQVAKVNFIAEPNEQVVVELDDASANRMGITPTDLSEQLIARNRILPGGSLAHNGQTVRLRPLSEFSSVEEIAATPIVLNNDSTVALSEIAKVRMGAKEPTASKMRVNGEMSVGITVIPRKAINLVDFGQQVNQLLKDLRPKVAPLKIETVTFQPKRTEARLAELNQSLLLGVLIVGGILVTFMGIRLGLMVASIVPLVCMASVAGFAMGGGILHQISIAALVISLGMLVDNAIVIAENIQWHLDRGVPASRAAATSVRELAVPLAGATATTIAAFVPMLISNGATAEFTRTIPVVIILTLTVSYLFAIFVTPNLARMILRPAASYRKSAIESIGGAVARFSTRYSWWIIGLTLLIVMIIFQQAGNIKQQFFPTSDRNQFLVDLKLPEGTHLDRTDAVSRSLETALRKRPNIRNVAGFMGRSAPHFYYNVSRVPFSPHFAQLIVETHEKGQVDDELKWLREFMAKNAAEVTVVPRKLEQGPPVNAPVEIRLFSDDFKDLNQAAGQIMTLLNQISDTRDVRHDLDSGAPTLRFHINDAAAGRYGITRAQVAQALYGYTRGLPAGELYLGEDPVDIVVRSAAGEHTPISVLENIEIRNSRSSGVPLSQVARLETAWRPSVIKHYNAFRVATVSSQLADGVTFSQVLQQLQPMMEKSKLPDSVRVGIGGEAEGSGEANSALLKNFPIGILLLFGVLLAEFNSFKRLGLILTTVPLAAVGIIPGLLIADQPFGFMSMLGVIALVGIVVNNAIVLIELIDAQQKEGRPFLEAIEIGVKRRIRPILLTSATTVAGLLPLALSSSTMWPPLASAMISGLIASTLLTIVVVPALYRILLANSVPKSSKLPKLSIAKAASLLLVLVPFFNVDAAQADQIDLKSAMLSAQNRPLAQASRQQVNAAESNTATIRNSAIMPTVTVSTAYLRRNEILDLQTPIGALAYQQKEDQTAGLHVSQPIFDAARQFYEIPAAKYQSQAVRHQANRVRQQLAAKAAEAYLNILGIFERIQATELFVKSLEARAQEMQTMIDAGRALAVDGLKIQLAYEQALQDLTALKNTQIAARADFIRTLGIQENVTPMAVPLLLDKQPLNKNVLISRALSARQDLKQYTAELDATAQRRSAVNAEYLPRLDANASYNWIKDSPYQTDNWVEGGIQLTWTFFAANSRNPRKAALTAQKKSVSHQITETRRQIKTELTDALTQIKTAQKRYKVESRAVEQTRETLRVERERSLTGQVTTNDLLEAEADLRERLTQKALTHLNIMAAWVNLWLAVGEDEFWFLDADNV